MKHNYLSKLSLSVGAAAAAASILAAGALPADAAARGITVAVSSAVTTLDPYDATDALSKAVVKSMYEGLFAFDKNLVPQPQLAESYEVSPDGLVYTFKLRQGVKFHDGTEFTSEAVKLNIERVLDPANALHRRTFLNFIDRVEPDGPYTVRFVLKHPMSAVLARLANGTAQMICPSAIKKEGSKGLAFKACGTGPYVFKEFKPGEHLLVEKNPAYRVAGLPKLDSINWVTVPENSTRASMVLTGEADYVHNLAPELVERTSANESVSVFNSPSIYERYLAINVSKKPFTDERVRKAIAYAINKDAFGKVVFSGYARTAEGVIPTDIPGAKRFDPWPYDPKKARELLKEAGYPNGFKTKLWSVFNSSTDVKALQFLQQQLRQVGISAEVQPLDAAQCVSLVDNHKDPATAPVRLIYTSWSNSTAEPDWGIRPLFDSREVPPVLGNYSYYNNPKVDAALDRGMAETDEAKRLAAYGEAQGYIWNEAPAVFLVWVNNLAAANKHLKNFHPLVDSTFEFYNASWEE